MSRALELCFQLKQYDALYQIAEDLSQSTSPEMVTRVCNKYILVHTFRPCGVVHMRTHLISFVIYT